MSFVSAVNRSGFGLSRKGLRRAPALVILNVETTQPVVRAGHGPADHDQPTVGPHRGRARRYRRALSGAEQLHSAVGDLLGRGAENLLLVGAGGAGILMWPALATVTSRRSLSTRPTTAVAK